MAYFKAFIRVVKSIGSPGGEYFGASNDVAQERLIEAEDKEEVKKYLADTYPQFFPKAKVYEKETKDTTQFFYAVIYPLFQCEVDLVLQGKWICKGCGHSHENRYISRPFIDRNYPFAGLEFCDKQPCYENYKAVYYKDVELPDDEYYVKSDSLCSIYKITEKATGKSYVGKTRNAPFFRWWNHLKHSPSPFGLKLRTSSLTEWTFEVLEELPGNTPDEIVFKKETEYMVLYDTLKNGYNTTPSNKSVVPEYVESQLKLEFS